MARALDQAHHVLTNCVLMTGRVHLRGRVSSRMKDETVGHCSQSMYVNGNLSMMMMVQPPLFQGSAAMTVRGPVGIVVL